jgi:hypothetical protein
MGAGVTALAFGEHQLCDWCSHVFFFLRGEGRTKVPSWREEGPKYFYLGDGHQKVSKTKMRLLATSL